MANYQRGDVVLVSFPFTGSTVSKRRPALVLLDTGGQDIVAARVTSRVARPPFDVGIADWRQAGLRLPSLVRVHKAATIQKQLVERRLGALTHDDWAKVRAALQQICALV